MDSIFPLTGAKVTENRKRIKELFDSVLKNHGLIVAGGNPSQKDYNSDEGDEDSNIDDVDEEDSNPSRSTKSSHRGISSREPEAAGSERSKRLVQPRVPSSNHRRSQRRKSVKANQCAKPN